MRKSLQSTPNHQINVIRIPSSQCIGSYQQIVQSKQNFNQIQPIEMETFAIGQPISQDGVPLMTPLLQLNSQISQNQNYCQTPTSMRAANNKIQITSPLSRQLNKSLNQLKFEQFPDSDLPQTLYCFKCNKLVITQVEEEYGCGTYSVALGLCILFFPCAFIPFMQKQCKDYIHNCGECKTYLGKKVFLCRLC
ncbi:LITAF-like zinc ribbon domain protein (macronuclear) [Tetrahymena thermophila SB210]|uniref:LITAF-like zinc ribbon domain protein n=1 Tax=Tetrahymena thermophila (strain SB210) TaxID=312017 RepID=I7MKX6_TETTS|nr:LITAF-like zinc ribbon domain protein [Tetrahymena thermophila SB210]EAS00568.2 LITAF-like zinc ribbon domain protein [Tetrahymena thermophila SB210]|eukprot:XP_001020813.2 LITAF-like zinc ribbon domain protein [Tetrahymena thermophila SB210]